MYPRAPYIDPWMRYGGAGACIFVELATAFAFAYVTGRWPEPLNLLGLETLTVLPAVITTILLTKKCSKKVDAWMDCRANVVTLDQSSRILWPVSVITLLNSERPIIDLGRPSLSVDDFIDGLRTAPPEVVDALVRYLKTTTKMDMQFDNIMDYIHVLDDSLRIALGSIYDRAAGRVAEAITKKTPSMVETVEPSLLIDDYFEGEAEKILLDHNVRQLLQSGEL